MELAVSRRPLTAEARVQSQDSPHESGKSGTGTLFSEYCEFFLQYHSSNAPYLLIHLSPTPHNLKDELTYLRTSRSRVLLEHLPGSPSQEIP